ncbi:MAG TPA: MaoC family dehydratase N-terminal domain-containing protein [Geodermatophilus sp.]|nr:MaoC family dehydratase N-terminal domain-containing protein [Geodermatophilus sp.]
MDLPARDLTVAYPGPVVVTEATVEAAPVQALAALFDDGLPAPRPGEPLPPLWHWAALATWPGARGTGPDGHPATGGFLPDVGRPRRMFAGGSVRFAAPLLVGSTLRREQQVLSVTPKSGRQGDFVVVVVETRLSGPDGAPALVERQDIVYRDPPPPTGGPAPATDPLPLEPALLVREAAGCWRFGTDPTTLVRFSSATGNGHRIHYDWPYATAVEGYPGLVVHGPLMTLAMAEVLRLEDGGAPVRAVEHRNRRPLFCGRPARIVVDGGTGGRRELALSDEDRPGVPNGTLTVEVGDPGPPRVR